MLLPLRAASDTPYASQVSECICSALLLFFLPIPSLSTVSSVHFSVFFRRLGASVRFRVAASQAGTR